MRGFWIAVAYLLVLAALAHPLGQALPRRWFDGGRFPYRCYKWEKQGKLYTRIGIERWKKLVPDMSRFLPDMVKKEASDTLDKVLYELSNQMKNAYSRSDA